MLRPQTTFDFSYTAEPRKDIQIPAFTVSLVRESMPSVYIESPDDVTKLLKVIFEGAIQEKFVALYLDTKNAIIGYQVVHVGDLNSCIVDPRDVFRGAILAGASAVIVSHNHPSGDPTPSPEDYEVTRRLKDAAGILKLDLLDHIVFGNGTERWMQCRV